jgi:hypothetical protein
MKIFTFSTQKCFFIGNLLNFKLIALGLMVLFGIGNVRGQAPYIESGQGIGQYGYLEKDASATHFRLNSSTYGNIYELFARSWISSNILTYGTAPNTCNSLAMNTNNYSFGSISAGNVIYSSVHANYCGGGNSYSGNPNQTGFNERSFFVVDVVGKTDALVPVAGYSSTNSNVVLSFTLSNNNTSGQTLNRLWIQNDGTATEGTDIVATNGAFRVYYEAATGSETFNGSESYAELFGNYNSNATNNNVFGNDALGVSIPQNSTGGLRCYVVLMGTSTYLNSSAQGKTVLLSVMADGISITPNRDGSFGKLKMDALQPSATAIPIVSNLYSKSTGDLNSTSTWGTNSDGTGTSPSNFTMEGITYNIRNSATPTIGASWTVSGTGSKIVVGDGTNACNFTIPSTYVVTSTATDISNNATVTRTSSAAQSFGTMNVLAGATYLHNYTAGSLPTATWASSSTLQINSTVAAGQLSQTFGNVNYNVSGGTNNINNNTIEIQSGSTLTVQQGTLTFQGNHSTNLTDTWSGNLRVSGGIFNVLTIQSTGDYDATLTVNNLTIDGGTLNINNHSSTTNTPLVTLNVNGTLTLSSGILELVTSSTPTSSNVNGDLNIVGNFSWSGGTLRRTNNQATGPNSTINFTGTSGTQTFTQTLGSTTYSSSGRGITWSETGASLVDVTYIGTSGTANNLSSVSGNVLVNCSGTCTYATSLTIASGKSLTIGSASPSNTSARLDMGTNTLTLTGSASTVHGFLRSAGTITGASTSTLTFSTTGTYEHNFTTTQGTIPTSTWQTGSTCSIVGYTSASTLTAGGGWGQSFHHFTWNCTNQTASFNLLGLLTTVNGNFTLQSVNSGSLTYNTNSPATPTLSVGGDFTVNGNFNLNNGTSTPVFNISGNFNHTGGTISKGGGGITTINFNKASGTQTFSQSGGSMTATVNWNIGTGSTTNNLELGSNVNLGSGTGTLTVANGSALDLKGYALTGSFGATINGTGVSNSGAFYTSTGTSSFARPITLGTSALIKSSGTSLTLTGGVVTASGKNLTIDGTGSTTFSTAAISGAGSVVKNGAGNLTYSFANTYTGSTTLNAGTLTLGANTAIATAATGGGVILNGGTYSSGASTGYTAGTSSLNMGTLTLTENTALSLGTGAHSIYFAASDAVGWTSGKTLTITGWTGTSGASGTAGKIFIGSSSLGLTSDQLAQISINGELVTQLSTGEIVPKAISFRSKQSGNWNDQTTWQSSADGSNWVNASSTPSNSSGSINILSDHNVTVSASVSVDELTVNSGGTLTINASQTLTIANGTGTDCIVNGTISNAGTITTTGTLDFGSTGLYVHNQNGGTVPAATWNASSICKITGVTSSFPSGITNTGAQTNMFGSFIWDCPNQNSQMNFASGASTWTSFILEGNLTVNNTGSSELIIGGDASSYSRTFTVKGNFELTNTGTNANLTLTEYDDNITIAVNGNVLISSGTLNLSSYTISAGGPGNIDVKGNFTHTGGTITETGLSTTSKIVINGTTAQTIESTGRSNTILFSINQTTATGTCSIASGKTFVNSSGNFTVTDNASTSSDFTINGTFRNSAGTITFVGTTFSNTGVYEHNTGNGGAVPTATWNAASLCKITSTGTSLPTGLGQNFGNFEWANSTHSAGNIQMSAVMTSIQGSFTLSNTGTGSLRYNAGTPASPTFSIGGDFIISAGTFDISSAGSTPTINISGNFSQSGGTITESGSGSGTISFVKSSGGQTFTQSAGTISNSINWNVGNGTSTNTVQLGSNVNLGSGTGTFTVLGNATFDAGTYILSGSAASTLNSGATLVTANSSGVNGSITLSGTRTYNAAANYTFNGASAQVTGAAVTAANNLTLNNSAGLTLSAGSSVTGTLTLTNGKLTLSLNDLTLGSSASISGASASNYIVTNSTGQLKRSGLTTEFTFPVGNAAYNPIAITNSGTSDTYGVIVTDGAVSEASVSTDCVNRRWYITEGTGGGGNLTVAPKYNTGETGATYTTGSQVYVGLYVPTTWTKTTATLSGSNPFTASASGFNQTLASSSYFAIGNEGIYLTTPTVSVTTAATSLTNNSASSGGETITGGSVTSKGVVWNTSTAPTVALSTKTNDGTGSTNFTSSLTSLSPQTLYYIRAFATNAAGTGYGDEKTFRTLSNPATVQATSLVANATSSSNIDLSWTSATFPSTGATNKGYVLLRATAPNNPTLGNSNGAAPTAGSNTTIVSSVIAENVTSISSSALAASTQYNYLLIPYTWDGTNATTYNYLTASAPTASATTTSGATPPVLTTSAATSVTSSGATLNGEITSDGGSSVTARGFVYSTSDNTPTIGEGGVTDQSSGSGTGTFNSSVSSLSPNTTYYYQAYATSASGTSYGGVVSFTTLKAEPSAQATTLLFSSITTSSFSTAFTAATGSPDGYLVIRSTSASLSANPVDGTTYSAGNSLGGGTVVSVGSTISGISNTSLSAGTTYYTFVFAYNNSGSNIDYRTTSPLSASTITLTDAPATPTFSSITTSGFTVDWTATTGASSYRLDVSTASDFTSYVSGYQDLTVNGTSQAVTGLTANTLYYARIRAVNASGTSANSTSGNSATLPNAPTVGTASSITTSGLTANWTAPGSQGAVTFTYTVELSTNSSNFSSPVSTASSIASGTTTNAFSSLSEGTTYYYRIKAVNSAGNSAWSSVSVGATTLMSVISLTSLGTTYTENFNGMGTSGTATTPNGIRIGTDHSTALTSTTLAYGNSGTGVVTSTSSGGAINWADGETGSSNDRALGFLTTTSYTSPRSIVLAFKNNTGSTITNVQISWNYEKYRSGTRELNWTFFHGSSSSPSTAATDGDQNYPSDAANTTIYSPSSNTAKSVLLTGLSIADGATYYLRWAYTGVGGSTNAQGVGIDDLIIKPCGTVSAPTASNQAFCSAISPTVASLTATGTALQWYSSSTGGTALSTSTALTNSTTYHATQTVGGCESVTRSPVVVTINSNPSAPTGSTTQTLCSGATVAELSATGSSIQWYSGSTGGSALATNTALVNSSTYYASQTTNSCESTTRFAATAAIVSSGSWIGGTSTDWSNTANWCGGVPTSATNVTIPSGTANSAVISSSVSVNSLTINSGATLSTSGTPTITVSNNGSFTNNGTFTAGSSKVSFVGNGTVSGTVSFNDVDIAGGVNFGTASTVNGTLSMNANSFVNTNAPTYGTGSTLKYNTGGTYGRSSEWSATSGAGAPHSVQISNSTTLNYPNSANGGANAFSTNLSLAGNLTVDNGSALYMDYGGSSNKSGRLDISGDVLLNGNLSLGNASGGDIKVGGNWTRNSGSTLNTNNRAIFFNGSGTSIISGNGGETFPYMVNEKTGGSIQLGSNLTLTAPNVGNALTHKSTASIDLNGNDLTFSGPDDSNILADGACSITGTGNVLITSNTKNLTGQNSGSWTFGSNVNLKLQSGLNFGTNLSTVNGTLEISSGGFVSGNGRPSYGVGSTLKYNSTGTYGRNTEWLSGFSSGAGVPYNVLISAGTTLDPGANSNFSSESWVRNELSVDGTFDMSLTDQVEPINVLGNVTFNNGTLKLSTTAGGDIKVGGNWSGTGTFTPNSRAVFFNGTGNQSISRNDNFPYLIIDKASGTLTIAGNITLNNKLTYSDGSISFSGGSIDASGASAEVEFANSSAFTLPTGLFSGNVNNLTLNGTGGVTLSENVTVTNNLKLTSGVITLGSRNLTLTGGLDATGNGNSSSYINTSGSGALIRSISTTGVDYKFPVGLSNYSPISVNFTGGTITSSSLASRAVSGLHPNATDGAYIRTNLYWEMNQTGMTNPQYNVSFTYPGVTNGTGSNETESNLLPAKWSASTGWLSSGSCSVCFNGTTMGTSSINTATKTITWNGVTGFSDFSGFGQGNGSPLPVELTSFTASCDEEVVTLSWSTASEQNSSHFDVEKSTDGENWRVIGTISAAGNSTQDIHYSFVDSEKSNDQNYYRLNQVDIDGKNEYFGPITVACEENTKINTYPNPSKGEFNLVMHAQTNEKVTFKITDGNSRVISTKVLDLQNGINLFPIRENLSSGVYHIQLITESGKTTVLKHSIY